MHDRHRRTTRQLGTAIAMSLLLAFATSTAAAGVSVAWTRQFGSSGDAAVRAVATDSDRNTYVAGSDGGAYLRKYRPNGSVAWTRRFGSAGAANALGVAVDRQGRIYVVGETNGRFPGQPDKPGTDAYLRRFTPWGATKWTRQFSSDSDTGALGVAVDRQGRVYVVGKTDGRFPGQPDKGDGDAFLRKFTRWGATRWTRQFGTPRLDIAYGVSVDPQARIYVAGSTDGTFPGKRSKGDRDAFLRRFTAGGSTKWTRQFGTSAVDDGFSVAADELGRVYVAGGTGGTFPGQRHKGAADGFLRRFAPGGSTKWTRQFGTAKSELALGVATDRAGRVYVTGWTDGVFPGQSARGASDAFLRRFGFGGRTKWTRQFGTTAADIAYGVAADQRRRAYPGGSTSGAFPGHANAGGEDAFLRAYRH